MSPPVSYYNNRWGRRNSDFDLASSRTRSRSRSRTSSTKSAFSHAPARRSESPPQLCSPLPRRGSITDLPATRVAGYGQVMATAQDQGFAAPSRESVQAYAERPLPSTPTSIVSVEEMPVQRTSTHLVKHPLRRKKSWILPVRLPPTPTSIISASEEIGEDGRVRGVGIRTRCLGPSPIQLVAVHTVDEGPDSPTLGKHAQRMSVTEGRLNTFDHSSSAGLSFDSIVDSLFEPEAVPLSPAYLRRMRKRAEGTLKWLKYYRED